MSRERFWRRRQQTTWFYSGVSAPSSGLCPSGENQTDTTRHCIICSRNSALRHGFHESEKNYKARFAPFCRPLSYTPSHARPRIFRSTLSSNLLGIHSSVALLGLVLHRAATPEYYQFAIFVGCFGLYALLASQLWVAATKLQDAQLRLAAHHEPDTTADNKVIKDHTGDKRYPKKLDSKNFTRMNRR